jgi:peptide methionine sulfoxide reductase MsrA
MAIVIDTKNIVAHIYAQLDITNGDEERNNEGESYSNVIFMHRSPLVAWLKNRKIMTQKQIASLLPIPKNEPKKTKISKQAVEARIKVIRNKLEQNTHIQAFCKDYNLSVADLL